MSSNYFDKFLPNERTTREAVGEVTRNYAIVDELHDAPYRQITTMGTTYGYGSPEPKPGTVRKPGVRRTSGKSHRKQRWSQS
jgi:hypothetical protein